MRILQIPPTATKVEIARAAGVSRTTLYKWLRGEEVTKPIRAAIEAAIKAEQAQAA